MPERALDLILSEPWLIQPEAMNNILAIAQRHLDSPELLAARQGKPLDNTRKVELYGSTAVIPVRGPVFRYANLFTEISGATSLEILAKDFAEARDNAKAEKIVLALDTPGGQATGIAEFAQMIRESNKPVIAHAGDAALSAGYWIAAASHEVVSGPTGMIGSIGVVGTYRPDKSGAIRIISTQSPLKQADPGTEVGLAELQRQVDDLAAVFVSQVAEYRGTSVEDVLANFGRGGVLLGERAVAVGMADRVATLESLLAGDAGSHSTEAYMPTNAKQGGPEITREYLQANHSDLYGSILAEGAAQAADSVTAEMDQRTDELLAQGAEQERVRIQAVREQIIPGHEELIEKLAFDGKTTGPEAAVAVLAAERELRAGYQRTLESAPPAVNAAEAPPPASEDTFEDKLLAYRLDGMSKTEAMKKAVREHPGLHKAWLARINAGRKAS